MGLTCGLQVLGSPTVRVCGVSLVRVTKLVTAFDKRCLWEGGVLNNSVAFTICIRGATKSATHQLTGRTGGVNFQDAAWEFSRGISIIANGTHAA